MPSRQRKLDAVVAKLQLRYGSQAIRRAESGSRPVPVPHIPTGFTELDAALGIGGLPRGRISEIVGPATSGKVTLAAKVLASAHREPGTLVAWVDLGRTCDPDYLHRCGLDLDRVLIVRPEGGADGAAGAEANAGASAGANALAITLHLVESNTLAALVFDGLAELSAKEEPLLAGTLERLATSVTHTETAVVFLVEPHAQYRTLAHLASVRLEIRRERWIEGRAGVRGYEGRVRVIKHKLGVVGPGAASSGVSPVGATVPIRILFNGTVRSDGQL